VFGMANRGILFVDNIHKLDNEKKELLIEAMETGKIHVRKSDSLDIIVPAEFRVVGTITGFVSSFDSVDRRLLDLFDIRLELREARQVENKTIGERIEMIKQTMTFESDPLEYRKKLFRGDINIRETILKGRKLLQRVKIDQSELTLIAKLNEDFANSGHEADISMSRISRTLAAFEGKESVEVEHIRQAAELTYRFRGKKTEEQVEKTSSLELLKSLVKNYAKE